MAAKRSTDSRRSVLATWALVVGVLAIAVGIVVVGLPEEPQGATDGSPSSQKSTNRLIAATAEHVAEQSRGIVQPPAVQAAPLPPRVPVPPAPSSRSPRPDGYSLVGFDGEMAKALIGDRGEDEAQVEDGLDWLASPNSIETLVSQAAAAGRGWSFGWLRLAEDARQAGLATRLEDAGAVIVGSAGRLLRVRLPGDEVRLAAIAALPGVDGLGAQPAETKLRAFAGRSSGPLDSEPTPVFVTLMADDHDGRWRRELEALGVWVGRYDRAVRTYTANVTGTTLDALAQADFVLSVEPVGIVEPAHDTAVPAMGADALRVRGELPGVFTGPGGAGVPVGVIDTGLNVNHPDIAERRESICGVNLFWLAPSANDRDLWIDVVGHGTHVTGTIVGNGYLAPRFAGMAPSVQHIRFAKVFHHDQGVYGGTSADMVNRAMDFLAEESGCNDSDPVRPLVVNMSLSGSSRAFVGRDVNARKLDSTVWGERQLYVVAQSNEAADGFSNYAAAKNSLSVGAAFDDGAVAPFSSHGPTGDGRLAPQVVATGVGVCSAEGNGKGAGYVCDQGTSMAAPSVAGVAALLLDANADYRSQPALARARLMASAVRPDAWLEDPASFPRTNANGPGTLQALYGMGKVSARTAVLDRDRADGWVGGAATAEVEDESRYAYSDIEVPEGASRLDVVLTWDEPPTEAIATPVLNDLDLWLDRGADCGDGPCGERYSVSRIDNVEWIVVRDPEPGTYRAKVVPRRIYTAPPRAAVSWTVIRGASTPNLWMTVKETPLVESPDRRTLELDVAITADAYVAAGLRLHLECRGEGADCQSLTVAGATVGREDGLAREASEVVPIGGDESRNERRSPIGPAERISLGEIAVGEQQSVTMDVAYSGEKPLHLYLTASAWNARGVSRSIAVSPPGVDADTPDPLGLPANDDFANAESLDTAEGSSTVDLVRATPEPGEFVLRSDYGRPLGSVWYEWTAPSTDLVRFGVAAAAGASMDAYLEVYRGERLDALEHVVANRRLELLGYTPEGYPVRRTIFTDAVFFAEEGDTYRVRVAHGEPSVPLVMRWRQGPRPMNDDFRAAESISGMEGSVDGTNLGATLESGESFGPLAATTWYRWTAPEDGSWRFEADSDHLLRVMVFSGTEVGDVRLVSAFPGTAAAFKARGGDEYRIAVASRDADVSGGSYSISWDRLDWSPAPADHFAEASGNVYSFSLGEHTVEPGEPAESGVRTRWWSWTAPDTGRFALKLVSVWTELTVAAYVGDTLENLELVATTGPEATGREFSFHAEAGERYWLSIGWPAGDYGAYASAVAVGYLFLEATPVNDELAGALGLGSTRGGTVASNLFATTASGELADQSGHSTLWWTYEAPTSGWYEFSGTEFDHGSTSAPVLAVFEVGADGLRPVARSRDGTVVFHADAGKRYVIRTGTVAASVGRDLSLRWRPTDAPAWLKYAGSFTDAVDGEGDPVRLIDPGSLAVDADGRMLYAVSPLGLTVFERDAETGALTGRESVDDDLSGSLLVLDPVRERLIADRCGTWRVYTGLADAKAIEANDLVVEGDPANCGRRLFFDPEGAFLYRVAPEVGIDVFAIDGDGFRHEETTQVDGMKDAVIAPNGEYVYAAQLDSTSHLRTFRRDAESGSLSRQSRYQYFRDAVDMDTLSITDDERLFVTRRSSGNTFMFGLDQGVLNHTGTSVSLFDQADLSVRLTRPFEFASARPGAPAVDVFGASAAVGFEVEQGQIDLLANGQPDRFGNRVPLFGAPNGLASSPDGRHVYVASYDHGIVAFERVGAGVEAEDPHVRLDILEVSSGTISFAAEMDSDGCIAVSDLDHNGTKYTVRSSKWQRRPNADWPWTDVAGTATTGELCPHTPTEPGHYRLVTEIEVDGESRHHTSNVLVEDDHGDSIDDATAVEIPSATAGWLDPDDVDYFRIEPAQSGELTVHSEGWADVEGRLLDEDGDFIASDGDSGADSNFRIVRDVDADTYFVRVHGYRGAPGDYTLHVGFEPDAADLIVDSVSVSDAAPDPGATFTLNATVHNSGDADAPATTLRYYRSVDDSISRDDTEVGTDEVDVLAASATSDHSIELTAPDETGTFYYGACVDAVAGERDATNNCSAAATGPPTVFDLDADNSYPAGIAYANGLLYVLDWIDDRVYAYTTAGRRRPDSDFELAEETHWGQSITYADGLLYVGVRDTSSPDKVYAYTVSGEHRPDSDFDLESREPWWPSGIAHAVGLFYIADQISGDVFVYTTSGERRSGADFELDGQNSRPLGIAHADGRLYVVNEYDDNVYVYTTSGVREEDLEFDLVPDNDSPEGATYANGRFYVVDDRADQVFVYAQGEDGGTPGPDLVVESPSVDDDTPDPGGP